MSVTVQIKNCRTRPKKPSDWVGIPDRTAITATESLQDISCLSLSCLDRCARPQNEVIHFVTVQVAINVAVDDGLPSETWFRKRNVPQGVSVCCGKGRQLQAVAATLRDHHLGPTIAIKVMAGQQRITILRAQPSTAGRGCSERQLCPGALPQLMCIPSGERGKCKITCTIRFGIIKCDEVFDPILIEIQSDGVSSLKISSVGVPQRVTIGTGPGRRSLISAAARTCFQIIHLSVLVKIVTRDDRRGPMPLQRGQPANHLESLCAALIGDAGQIVDSIGIHIDRPHVGNFRKRMQGVAGCG